MSDRRRERAYTCRAHGPFRAIAYLHEAPRCPWGCDPYFVRRADGSPIQVKPRPPPKTPRPRLGPDERMTADDIRARLRDLLKRAPPGCQAALARRMGLRGKWPGQTLRALVSGRWHLYESTRRQLSRTLQQR